MRTGWTPEELFGVLLWIIVCFYVFFHRNSATQEGGRPIRNPLLRLLVGLAAFGALSAIGWVANIPLATPMWKAVLRIVRYLVGFF